MPDSEKAGRWGYRCLLAVELTVVVLLILGGCYSKQNYHVLSPQAGDDLLSKCNVVVEGRIVDVQQRQRESWGQNVSQFIFFCWPSSKAPEGPFRYDVSIDIDTILKGDSNMPRKLRIDNCRPLTSEESTIFAQPGDAFPDNNLRVRIGFDHQQGHSLSGLVVVPVGTTSTTAPTTKPHHQFIPSPPGH